MANPISDNLDKLTDAVLTSYAEDERTQRIGLTFLPSRSKIVEIIDLARQLLFPGYYGHKVLTDENIRLHVENLLVHLGNALTDQINQCLSIERRHQTPSGESHLEEAEEITHKFLASIPELRRILALDVQAAYDGDPAAKSIEEVVYCYPGLYAVSVYRVAHELLKLGVPLMPRIMTEHAHSLTGIDIHPGAQIGRSFFIDHGTGVVIGETTIIGDNCKLYQGVTLGAPSFPHDEEGQIIRKYKRHPTLEDDVIVYSNATILGNVTVGKGVTVGGNVFLTRSVPPGCTVSLKPFDLKYRNRRARSERGYVDDYQI